MTERDHLLTPLSTTNKMLSVPMDESDASKALFINNDIESAKGGGGGGDAHSATQKWEIVLVFPSAQPNTFVSPEEKAKQDARDKLVGQLRDVGLFVSQRESSDGKQTFLLLGASQDKFEEYAEMFGMELSLKDEFGGGFSAFTRKKRNLFKMKGSEGFFTKTERQRMIVQIIESDNDDGGAELNLRGMEYDGVLEKVYPLHENSTKKKIIDNFVKNKNPLTPIPLDDIRAYFGEEIAFYFAWLAFYTKWLAYASIFGIVTSIIGWAGIKNENYWSNTIYSIFIAIWATMFLEFWKRERNVRAWQWNMLNFETEETHRPGFAGTEEVGAYSMDQFIPLRKDEIYGVSPPKAIKNFPEEKKHARMAIAVSLIITLCIVVAIATFAVLTFRVLVQNNDKYSAYASVVGGIGNAIVIMIMNKVYRTVAVKLNDWENHRTQSKYTDNLLFKIFLFQFVNSYTSMYYIAFFKRNAHLWGDQDLGDSCGTEDKTDHPFIVGCPNQLYIQLLTILGTNIAVGQAQEVLIPLVMAKFKLYWLERNSQRAEADIPKYEREYQLNQFEGMVDEYGEMVIQYGYLTLFASSVPIAPLLAVLNNVVEMRTDMFKWLTSYNKPFYSGADDIGGWYTILQVLGVAAVITNSLLIIFSFPTLYTALDDNKYTVLWTVVIVEHIIFITKYVVSTVVPDIPSNVRSILAKQLYIQQQLVKKYERKNIDKRDLEESAHMKRELDEVEHYRDNM